LFGRAAAHIFSPRSDKQTRPLAIRRELCLRDLQIVARRDAVRGTIPGPGQPYKVSAARSSGPRGSLNSAIAKRAGLPSFLLSQSGRFCTNAFRPNGCHRTARVRGGLRFPLRAQPWTQASNASSAELENRRLSAHRRRLPAGDGGLPLNTGNAGGKGGRPLSGRRLPPGGAGRPSCSGAQVELPHRQIRTDPLFFRRTGGGVWRSRQGLLQRPASSHRDGGAKGFCVG